MSNKLKKQLADKTQVHTIEPHELGYMIDLTNIQSTQNYYFDQLKTNYLHQVAIRLGYKPEDRLEFSLDLKSEELTVKEVASTG